MPSSRTSPPEARVLGPDFFARSALTVARELVGKCLVRRIDGETQAAIIHETEAYIGPHDLACHASRGRTARTEVMFGPAGCWYVYFIYGIHWMLNVVTDRPGHASAVLVRGAGPWVGPARLTKALAIDRSLNGMPAVPETGLWVEDRGYRVRRGAIRRTPRINVDYSGKWAARPYRFVMEPPSEEELSALH